MNENALRLFHLMMKKGYIDRTDDVAVWSLTQNKENIEDLQQIGEEIGFEIVAAQNRYYLVPTQDNDLFLKNNTDYRKDISADKDVRLHDLMLMNYLAVYILYQFFHGQQDTLLVRDYCLKEDLLHEFSEHCTNALEKKLDEEETESEKDFSEDFRRLAENWLGKKEGSADSRKMIDRYGMLNRLVVKFKADELFTDQGDRIRPTQKLKDLMPYVLRKERVSVINEWIDRRKTDATDQ